MRINDLRPLWLAPSILLILVGAIYAACLPITDIRLYDETSYLRAGLDLFKSPPTPENAPLYALWYWLAGQLIRDNFVLYFASWSALVALCVAIPYAIERGRAAVIYACLACVLPFYVIWPYINLFSGALVLGALSIIESREDKSYVGLSAALLLMCSVVALVRPEFHNASYFAAVLLIGATIVEGGIRRHRRLLIASVAAFIAVEILFFAVPGLRSGIAFAAYDDWIRFKQGNASEAPRTLTGAYQVFGVGENATALDFLKANPAAFWSHVLFNITRIRVAALLGLGGAALLAGCIRIDETGHAKIHMPFRRLITLAIIYVPALAAMVIIYPKAHYFVIPYLASVYYIAHSDLALKIFGSGKAVAALAALAVVSILANFVVSRQEQVAYRMVDLIGCVTELQSQRAIDRGPVLEALGGLTTYLKGNLTWESQRSIKDGESPEAYVARVSPVLIISDDEMYHYFVQNGNLPGSVSKEEMESRIRGLGYEDYKCRVPAPRVLVSKRLVSEAPR